MTNHKGFTLIEILIVVAIIGLLSSIILVGLGSFNLRARDTNRITDLRQTENALALFYNRNQAYPPAGDWAALTAALIGASIGVTRVSNDPVAARTYTYDVSGDGQNYVLSAELEDAGNRELLKLNGTILTTVCDGAVYCTQSS